MGECCYLHVTDGQSEVTSPCIHREGSVSACSPRASSASAALSSLCTSDALPRSFASSLGGQRSARLAGSVVFHCLTKAFGGGGGLEGGEGDSGRRNPRPGSGTATAPPCAAPKPCFQSKRGEPGCSHASRTVPKAGVNSQRCSLRPGPHARIYLATLRRGSGEGHPGVERHAAPVGAAVPVELPAQGQVGCGETERGRGAGWEASAVPLPGTGRCPGTKSATAAHLGSLFIPALPRLPEVARLLG